MDRFTWNDISLGDDNISLGQGGSAAVVLAKLQRGRELQKTVALKVITDSFCDSKGLHFDEEKEFIFGEAEMLFHCGVKGVENVLKFYGLVEGGLTENIAKRLPCPASKDEQAVGLVMEYFVCKPLSQVLHKRQTKEIATSPSDLVRFMPLEERLFILRAIIVALVDLHALGMIHGDLKPLNVLVGYAQAGEKPVVRLIDFGLSKIAESSARHLHGESTIMHTMTTTVRGTPQYCAPEMLVKGESAVASNRSTDVYAFGIMCWEVLAREVPFKNDPNLKVSVCNGIRPPMTSLPSDTPRAVIEMMESCWDGDRKKRKSSTECMAILSQILEEIRSDRFDLFYSHAWVNKPFLSHVYRYLTRSGGYRVWYDQTEMGHDLKGSMVKGIENSKIMLVCLNRKYMDSENCMFELREAVKMNKPIVVLLMEKGLMNDRHEAVGLCRLKDHLYVDVSEFTDRPEWNSGDQEELMLQLSVKMGELSRLIKDVETDAERKIVEEKERLQKEYTRVIEKEHRLKKKTLTCQRKETVCRAYLLGEENDAQEAERQLSICNEEIQEMEKKLAEMRVFRSDKQLYIQKRKERQVELKEGITSLEVVKEGINQSLLQLEKERNDLAEHLESSFIIQCGEMDKASKSATFREDKIIEGHNSNVNCVVELSDGLVASALTDNTIQIWNMKNGECEQILRGHTNYVKSLIELSDGRLASGSGDDTVRIWNIKNGKCEQIWIGHRSPVLSVIELSDGRLASGSEDETIRIWNIKNREFEQTTTGHSSSVMSVLEVSDCRTTSEPEDKAFPIRHAKNVSGVLTLTGHASCVMSVVELSDGRLASGSGDETIRIWNVKNGQCEQILKGHSNTVRTLIELSDGRLASGSYDKTMRVWNVKNGECEQILTGHTNNVWSVIELSDGRLASGSYDKTIRTWLYLRS